MDPAWLADKSPILLGLGASLAAGLATGIGALPALLLGGISPRLQSAMLGFAAGVRLAATVFSLILPGLRAAEQARAGRRSLSSCSAPASCWGRSRSG